MAGDECRHPWPALGCSTTDELITEYRNSKQYFLFTLSGNKTKTEQDVKQEKKKEKEEKKKEEKEREEKEEKKKKIRCTQLGCLRSQRLNVLL